MTPLELRYITEKIGYGWQTKLATEMGLNARTIRRWLERKSALRNDKADAIRRAVNRILEENRG